jgi:hypothetical protein
MYVAKHLMPIGALKLEFEDLSRDPQRVLG